MSTGTIIGLETEYGVLANSGRQFDPAVLFQQGEPEISVAWDYHSERPWLDARGFVPQAVRVPEIELPLQLLQVGDTPAPPHIALLAEENDVDLAIETTSPPSWMLANGARFYLDHSHPEWCTPECATPLDVVTYDKVGEHWMSQLVALYNARKASTEPLTVFKNNVDQYGNSYGCHENYLMDAELYRDLYDRHAQRLYMVLIPFFVTRQILCGAGKVAPLASTGEYAFHISQRADLFETVLGLQTTHYRPLINTRDEPHADPTRFRRLHVILGDANMAEFSTYLKVGVTALVLEAFAGGYLRLDLAFEDPLKAVQQIDADPTCTQTVTLEAGGRAYRAVDVQSILVEAVQHYLDEQGDQSYRREVWSAWSATVNELASDPLQLAGKVDWVIKYQLLQSQMANRKWQWSDSHVRELDIKYHQLDPERSIFQLLQRKGLVESLIAPAALRHAQTTPPVDTRAQWRVNCLNRFRAEIRAASWQSLVFAGKEGRVWRWLWNDPRDNGEERLKKHWDTAASLEELLIHVYGEDAKKTEQAK